VRIDRKPFPEILHPEDAIVRVTRSCICGSDLHLYHGLVPDTRVGMTFGHEFTGVVEAVGPDVAISPLATMSWFRSILACGRCTFCRQGLFGTATSPTRRRLLSAVSTGIPTRPADMTAGKPSMSASPTPMSDLAKSRRT
jgi:threonine dehydrogenase-like Zn-dependent dehydrogenase